MGKRNLKKIIESKGGLKVIIGTTSLIIFAIACIVLGFGFGSGWDVVLEFFTSRWAIPFYIGIPLLIIIILYIIQFGKTMGDD